MKNSTWHLDLNQNIGALDRTARYFLSIMLIGIVMLAAPTPIGWFVLLPLIAIPIFISAFMGWDPIYSLLQKAPTPVFSFFKKELSK